MIEMPLRFAVIWICVMLIYLLGDVLRIFSGDFKPGEMGPKGGFPLTQGMMLFIAALMVTPILMIFLSVTLDQSANRWTNIVVAIFFILFNAVGLPTYPGAYDKFLLVVSMGFNALTVWYAWNWV